jgi:hypothetical protein
MESNSPKREDDGIRESIIGSRGGGIFQRVTQMHAFRALAHESRFSSAPPSRLQAGLAYEEDTPFASIRVTAKVHVEDAQALFALLAESENVNVLAEAGKITLTIGKLAPRRAERAIHADRKKKVLSFFRDESGRLLILATANPSALRLEGLRMLGDQVPPKGEA